MPGRKLILPLLMSTVLLAGCASGQQIVVMVPHLNAPPPGAITALEAQCKTKRDTATCGYIVDLDKHYEKLDAAAKITRQ